MESNNQLSFVDRLVKNVPELASLLEEHLKDYNEVLPHVFMGDVTRFARFQVTGSKLSEQGQLILEVLEEGMLSGNPDLAELISVSFLENLAPARRAGSVVINSLNPELLKQYKNIASFVP